MKSSRIGAVTHLPYSSLMAEAGLLTGFSFEFIVRSEPGLGQAHYVWILALSGNELGHCSLPVRVLDALSIQAEHLKVLLPYGLLNVLLEDFPF